MLPVFTVFLPEGQRVFGEKILFRRGASRVGDLDIALLNAVVSALARAAQWQQAQCRDLSFIVVLCVNSYPSWESTRRIIPVSKWLVTPIYKPFRPFGRGTTPVRGLTIIMVINHLQVLG